MTETFGQPCGLGQLPEKGMEPKPTISFDDNLLSSLATKDSLAAALTKQGRCDEAEMLLRGVLEIRETLGQSKADPDMLRTMNNLGGVLNGQESDEQSLGSEHTDTIISMTNLADALTRQGKLEEAEKLQRRALESSQKVHGPENHETLSVMGNLGDILVKLHNYEQAEKVSREVLELRQKLLSKREKFDEAEDLYRQKVAICYTNMEKITSMSDLARFLASRGRYDEAEHLLQDVMTLSKEAFGRNSSKTRSAISQLGEVLMRNDKYKEAEAMYRDLLVMGIA